MPFALQSEEDLRSGLLRIAAEQAASGIDSLRTGLAAAADEISTDVEDAWDAGVHDARRRCKEIRAVARLCRDALGDAYFDVNGAFRDTARILSDARDAWTLVETCELLTDGDLPAGTGEALRAALVDRYLSHRRHAADVERLRQALDAMEHAAARIASWPLPPDLSPQDLVPSIARVHRRGRRWWAQLQPTVPAEPMASGHEWHQWRKRVKYLWYHVRLLEAGWPVVLRGWQQALDDLSDALGDDHDLHVLVSTVHREQVLTSQLSDQVAAAAAARRRVLRAAAAPVAERVYAERSTAFAQRLCDYLRAAPLRRGDGAGGVARGDGGS